MSNKTIQFEKDSKSAKLTLEDLMETNSLADFNGKMPASCPIEGFQLIQDVNALIERNTGHKPLPTDIVIREPYTKVDTRRVKERGGDPILSDYFIQRFVTKMVLDLPEFRGTINQMRPGIAITYNSMSDRRGIQIAYGENVDVCDNLTAFGRYRFSTQGTSKVSFPEGMQLLTHWLEHFAETRNFHMARITQLMEATVTMDDINLFIGDLFTRAVRNNVTGNVEAPLNVSQMSAMVQAGVPKLEKLERIDAWDVLNWGTEILKPYRSDMVSLLDDTSFYNDFVYDRFVTNRPKVHHMSAPTTADVAAISVRELPAPVEPAATETVSVNSRGPLF